MNHTPVRTAATDYGKAALDTLYKIMVNEKSPAACRVSAAGLLLDRAYGRPNQPMVIDLAVSADQFSDDDLARLLAAEGVYGSGYRGPKSRANLSRDPKGTHNGKDDSTTAH
jgi:hypothetical protein